MSFVWLVGYTKNVAEKQVKQTRNPANATKRNVTKQKKTYTSNLAYVQSDETTTGVLMNILYIYIYIYIYIYSFGHFTVSHLLVVA